MKFPSTGLLLAGVIISSQAFVLYNTAVADWSAVDKKVFAEHSFVLHFQSIYQGKRIDLSESSTKHSPSLQMMRLYLSHFVFLKNGAVVFEEKNSYHLLDLADENTLELKFEDMGGGDFDQLQFNLGIDSLTHISGAMGGDLDPTKGMFWTWQSGYVNVKLEGAFEKCPTRNHEFQFHLGGYLAPFQSVQAVRLNIPKDLSTYKKLTDLGIQLDLTPFFKNVDWEKKYSIMSPCKEAVAASKILANSFSVHAE